MKTTIDISDPLLEKARRIAAREGTTLKALVEAGLRRVVEERTRQHSFTLRPATYKGRGLQREVQGVSWDRLRELAYEGRGG